MLVKNHFWFALCNELFRDLLKSKLIRNIILAPNSIFNNKIVGLVCIKKEINSYWICKNLRLRNKYALLKPSQLLSSVEFSDLKNQTDVKKKYYSSIRASKQSAQIKIQTLLQTCRKTISYTLRGLFWWGGDSSWRDRREGSFGVKRRRWAGNWPPLTAENRASTRILHKTVSLQRSRRRKWLCTECSWRRMDCSLWRANEKSAACYWRTRNGAKQERSLH